MAHEVQLIANNFLGLARRDGDHLDPMKIQKLVYVAHGWNLAFTGAPLVKQAVQAWPYGPVIAELYRDFKKFKALPITENAPVPVDGVFLDAKESAFLENVWSKYKHLSAIQLSRFTHEPGYAWDRTIRLCGPYATIPNELIRDEFIRRKQGA
jgi:uncharacterized phage-associated protein